MEWEIILHNDQKYLEIITKGVADKDGSLNMAKEIKEIMKREKFTRTLIDHSHLTNVSGNIIEVYERPKLFRLIGVILGIKIAEIIKPDHLEHFKFLETVCTNQGFEFSVFHDRANAVKWLLG